MKKLSLGIQDFATFKANNLIYVDKTQLIHKLIDDGSYYFLSRPRRFGKSLLVSTMQELFSGNKELFEDCWIYDQWDWEKKYPVIRISFAEIEYRSLGLEKALELFLAEQAEQHNVRLTAASYGGQFLELIREAGRETPAAVLIDEYDTPIHNAYFRGFYEKTISFFKSFLGAGLKDNPDIYKGVLTGILRVARESIFSDMNNLGVYSLLSSKFSDKFGLTEEQIRKDYADFYETFLN